MGEKHPGAICTNKQTPQGASTRETTVTAVLPSAARIPSHPQLRPLEQWCLAYKETICCWSRAPGLVCAGHAGRDFCSLHHVIVLWCTPGTDKALSPEARASRASQRCNPCLPTRHIDEVCIWQRAGHAYAPGAFGAVQRTQSKSVLCALQVGRWLVCVHGSAGRRVTQWSPG